MNPLHTTTFNLGEKPVLGWTLIFTHNVQMIYKISNYTHFTLNTITSVFGFCGKNVSSQTTAKKRTHQSHSFLDVANRNINKNIQISEAQYYKCSPIL